MNFNFTLIQAKNKKKLKKSGIFFFFWPKKQKIESQNLGLIFEKSLFKENIEIKGPYLRNLLLSSVPTYSQTFKGVRQPRRTKNDFKV